MMATRVRQSNCPGFSYANTPISAILILEEMVIHYLQTDFVIRLKEKRPGWAAKPPVTMAPYI